MKFPSADARNSFVDDFVIVDATRISWTRSLKQELGKGTKIVFDPSRPAPSMYRPFTRSWLFFDRKLNEVVYQMPRLFPRQDTKNWTICVPARCGEDDFSALLVDAVSDLNLAPGMGGYQCFPRFTFTQAHQTEADAPTDLFGSVASRESRAEGVGEVSEIVRHDAITDAGLKHFTDAYPGETITKDDLFYFVYGILHSPDYRARYADNLRRQLPRMPILKRAEDFWTFVEAGRKLGDLHVNYEKVEPYPVAIGEGDLRLANIDDPVSYFRVEKMKFAGKRPKLDKTTVIYNPRITITNIPLAAYEYVVNGRPALEWVMERQCVSTDPASGIVNDANAYANETVGDPRYPFDLFCRIITVSLETMEIVKGLPALDIRATASEPAA
jgi:predicted helicase